jgi:hypothetical protein
MFFYVVGTSKAEFYYYHSLVLPNFLLILKDLKRKLLENSIGEEVEIDRNN